MILAAFLLCAAPAFAQFDDSDKDNASKTPAVAPPPDNPLDQGADPNQGDTPTLGSTYESGDDGKYLLGGTWWFKNDPGDQGVAQGYVSQPVGEATGWEHISVPYVWNATDLSRASMFGSLGWYRKEFRVPKDSKAKSWVIRFESVNYTMQAWLNGKRIGSHSGAYLSFELPATGLKKDGLNQLVLRVDSRTNQLDLPPGGADETGEPDGGWWNYGGVNREVYLRRVASADFRDVLVRDKLESPTGKATETVTVQAKNLTDTHRRVKLSGMFGGRHLKFAGPSKLNPNHKGTWKATLTINDPNLWSPDSPTLYPVRIKMDPGDGTQPNYFVRHGIRTVEVAKGGVMKLNGQKVQLRGASIHEDDPFNGSALTPQRRQQDVALLKELGATITRAHYPLAPYTLELADKAGILVWAQAPVYQLRAPQLGSLPLRKKAVDYIHQEVLRDRNHASVFAWSLVNELPARPGSGQESLIQQMAIAVRKLDPTRLVALDIQGYPTVGPQEAYKILDAIGINDYFGWYPGPNGTIADRSGLGPYLDQMHAAYPDQALFVTEFGAEANRDGPLDEKGTYAFQRDLLRYHLSTFDARPWINGAIIWILRDFRVKPGWDGGNPVPAPPVNFKGLVTMEGVKKPAFTEIARLYHATQQLK